MPSSALWGALALLVVCGIAGLVYVVVRTMRLLRDIRGLKRSLGEGLARIAAASEELDHRMSTGANRADQLAVALARLAESRRRLAVLTAAVQDANDTLGRFTALIPRK